MLLTLPILLSLLSLISPISPISPSKSPSLSASRFHLLSLFRFPFRAPLLPIQFSSTRQVQSNITETQMNLLKQYLAEAEKMYTALQYNEIAKYVYAKMVNATQMIWNTYIYSNKGDGTDRIDFYAQATFSKVLVKNSFGKYGNSFIVWTNNVCLSQASGTPTTQFGNSITDYWKDRILTAVNGSITTCGNDMYCAAKYIGTKVGVPLSARWNVMIAFPDKSFGFHECHWADTWALLRIYGQLGWTYYISRSI